MREAMEQEQRKSVYAVTSGMYSDYHIERVFDTREEADKYASFEPGNRHVEAYFVYDSMEHCGDPDELHSDDHLSFEVTYIPESNRIVDVYSDYFECTDDDLPYVYEDQSGVKKFCLRLPSNERLRMDIYHHNTESELLKKIVQDRYAQFMAAEQGVSV